SSPLDRSDSGLTLKTPTLLRSNLPATRIKEAIEQTQEISLEAWVESADSKQNGPARILTMSVSNNRRNFLLAQDDEKLLARLRTSTTDDNGNPDFTTDKIVTKTLTHVVLTHDKLGVEHLFVDGMNVQ